MGITVYTWKNSCDLKKKLGDLTQWKENKCKNVDLCIKKIFIFFLHTHINNGQLKFHFYENVTALPAALTESE